jgi:hypothetical protein
VRDLLLGKRPDDLDLSLCLRAVPDAGVTVASLLAALVGFPARAPALGVSEARASPADGAARPD